jgi:hypothetical protein
MLPAPALARLPSPPTGLSGDLGVVVDNLTGCRATAAQLGALQEWVVKMQTVPAQ